MLTSSNHNKRHPIPNVRCTPALVALVQPETRYRTNDPTKVSSSVCHLTQPSLLNLADLSHAVRARLRYSAAEEPQTTYAPISPLDVAVHLAHSVMYTWQKPVRPNPLNLWHHIHKQSLRLSYCAVHLGTLQNLITGDRSNLVLTKFWNTRDRSGPAWC